ncbi:MAG: tetratricopeptide repeat protein [Armatimonadetes bacterium]|nr:tetratricopeptide repeat protein [Armatimonadota bacterium]MBS1725797.1 tetratricopeptide repeat protein [Armatimonadota bacterium]
MSDSYRAIADLFGTNLADESQPAGPIKQGRSADESDQLGKLSLEAGKYQEAIEHFKRAVEQRDPNDVSSRIDLAGALESSDQFPQAYRQYMKALNLKGDEVEPHAGLADLLKRHGKFRESLEHLRQGLEKDPNSAFLNFKMAETLRDAGAPRRALEYAVNAVVIKPDDPFFHYWIGDLHTVLGNYEEALQSLRAAVELSPGDDFYYLRCVVPFWNSGMRTEAIKAVRLASDLNPEKHLYHGILEELLRANGQDEEAELEVSRSSQMDRYDDDMLDRFLDELKF